MATPKLKGEALLTAQALVKALGAMGAREASTPTPGKRTAPKRSVPTVDPVATALISRWCRAEAALSEARAAAAATPEGAAVLAAERERDRAGKSLRGVLEARVLAGPSGLALTEARERFASLLSDALAVGAEIKAILEAGDPLDGGEAGSIAQKASVRTASVAVSLTWLPPGGEK